MDRSSTRSWPARALALYDGVVATVSAAAMGHGLYKRRSESRLRVLPRIAPTLHVSCSPLWYPIEWRSIQWLGQERRTLLVGYLPWAGFWAALYQNSLLGTTRGWPDWSPWQRSQLTETQERQGKQSYRSHGVLTR